MEGVGRRKCDVFNWSNGQRDTFRVGSLGVVEEVQARILSGWMSWRAVIMIVS